MFVFIYMMVFYISPKIQLFKSGNDFFSFF